MNTTSELRQTDTNAADDSPGRAFGLDGNLYLLVVGAILAGLGLYAVLALLLRAPAPVAGTVAALPPLAVGLWAALLRHGKPAGYDRDWLDGKLGRSDFTRVETDQGRQA